MRDAGFSWAEIIPPGSVQSSTMNFAQDSGQVTFNIRIDGDWTTLREAIKYILGYAIVFPIFNPNNLLMQGPYTLSRIPPARHPAFPAMRATKILSIQGRGIQTNGQRVAGPGYYGTWEHFDISILFEIPKYSIMTDTELAGRPEYLRNVEWDFDTNVETLARRSEMWSFLDADSLSIPAEFKGDRLLRQPKGVLKMKWLDVPIDYVKVGRTIPTNFLRRVGTVNAKSFPQEGFRDQNQAGSLIPQLGPGTLLLMPPRFISRPILHPLFFGPNPLPVLEEIFPRSQDVEISMIVFDPPTSDPSTIDLTAVGGEAAAFIRGHNLAPLPKPIQAGARAGEIWSAVGRVNPGDAVTRDTELLYQYSDFEQLFKPVESY